MNVNYVRGLMSRGRARYPLGFSPISGKEPATTCVVYGAGVSDTYPEISSLTGAQFLAFYLKTTNTGASEVYGEYMSLQSGGTGTGYVYTKGALAKSVAGGYVAEMGACYYKTQLTAGTVTGQAYVGFFEFIVDSGVANMPSGGVIQLVDVVSGSLNAVHGYITLRTYGTTPFSNLFYIMDHTSGAGKLFYESTLKINIGGTPYYIPLSTTERGLSLIGGIIVGISGAGHDVTFYGDTVGCNFLWDQNLDTNGGLQLGADTKSTMFYAYGATTGNYLKWDAANDDLLLVGTATQLAVAGTVASSSTTTGSLRTAGGLGVVGAAWIGGGISSSGQTLTPDANRTYIAYQIGTRAAAKDITMATATGQNLDPVQINLNIIGTAPTDGTLNGIYQQITHSTTDMPNLRLKGCDWTITTDKQCQDAYVVQTELIVSGTKTSSGELMAMSALTTLGAGARTADRVLAFQAMITGDGTAGTVVGDCFVAYIVNAGTVITTDAVLKVFNQSASTATNLASIETDGTCTSMLQFTNDGTTTYLLDIDDNSTSFVSAAGAGGVGANPVKIKVQIDGGTKYLIAADGWS